MSFILIFGLVLMSIVSTTQGINSNWIGKFKIDGTCDKTTCCCPPDELTIIKEGTNNAQATITPMGNCLSVANTTVMITNQQAASSSDVHAGVALSILVNTLTVQLNKPDDGSSPPPCNITMQRQVTSPGTNSTGSGSTSSPTASEASSNPGSILIIFISIIMTTTVIMHI